MPVCLLPETIFLCLKLSLYHDVQNQVWDKEKKISSGVRNCPTSELFSYHAWLDFFLFGPDLVLALLPASSTLTHGYRSLSPRRKVLHPKFFGWVFFSVPHQGSRFTLHITSKLPFTDATSKPILHWAYRLNSICFWVNACLPFSKPSGFATQMHCLKQKSGYWLTGVECTWVCSCLIKSLLKAS